MDPRDCTQCHNPLPNGSLVFLRRDFCTQACLDEFQRPEPGKAATYNIGSDYYPFTIIAVSKTGAKLTVRQDRTVGKGLHAPADSTEVEYAHRTQTGAYRMGRCGCLYIGVRHKELDPGF